MPVSYCISLMGERKKRVLNSLIRLPRMGIDLVVKVHCALAKSKGVVVRQGLKEAGGKIAGLRTETAYKACMMDESAN